MCRRVSEIVCILFMAVKEHVCAPASCASVCEVYAGVGCQEGVCVCVCVCVFTRSLTGTLGMGVTLGFLARLWPVSRELSLQILPVHHCTAYFC